MSKKKKSKATAVKSGSVMTNNVAVAPVAQIPSGTPVMQLIIQSPSGQEITPEDVRAKISTAVGAVEKVYIRPDDGKAYWVRGEGEKEEHGAVELW